MESFEHNPMEPISTGEEEQVTQPIPEMPQQEPFCAPCQEPEAPVYTAPQQEPVHNPYTYTQPQQTPYRNAGAGRKESPFADAPYVMHPNCGNHTQYQQPGHNPYATYQGAAYNPQPKAPRVKKPWNKKLWKGILCAILALAVVGGTCSITAYSLNTYWKNRTDKMIEDFNKQINDLEGRLNSATNEIIASGVSQNGNMTPAQVYAQNVGAVVAVSNHSTTTNIYGQVSQTAASGSGFVISEDGYVVTNYHVVQGATSLTVILSDSTEYTAKYIGGDSANDLAVLKIEATGLQHVTLGSSDSLIVGDQVVAIGNPLGELTSTLTAGYISAKDRDVSASGMAINMIQTDAAINSGNSGGPLFNMNGEVVGITTAKYSGTSSSGATIEGIGFAIPMDDVRGMIEDLSQLGYITGAYLGVLVSDMDSSAAEIYGLPMGAYVQEVTSGYCAEEAGMKAKDIIVSVGSYEVESVNDLSRALRHFKGGDVTTVTVYRSGAEVVLNVTLSEKPVTDSTETEPETQLPEEESNDNWSSIFPPFFGEGNG